LYTNAIAGGLAGVESWTYLAGASTPAAFDRFILAAAARYNVPDFWIRAVIQTESSWDRFAYRAEPRINDASYGLMQLLTRTAAGLGYRGTPDGLFDAETNIDLGTRLLADLRSRYGNDFRRVYSAYNSGSPDRWETSSQVATHVSRALANLAEFSPAAIAGGGGALVLAGLALWFVAKRGRRPYHKAG
jgi:soluble lytic murein transglycosylase-like protein